MATKSKSLERVKDFMESHGLHILEASMTKGNHWRLQFQEVASGACASVIVSHSPGDTNEPRVAVANARRALHAAQSYAR